MFESELPTVTEPTGVPSTCICPFAATGSAGSCSNELPLKLPMTADCVIEGERIFSSLLERDFEDSVFLI